MKQPVDLIKKKLISVLNIFLAWIPPSLRTSANNGFCVRFLFLQIASLIINYLLPQQSHYRKALVLNGLGRIEESLMAYCISICLDRKSENLTHSFKYDLSKVRCCKLNYIKYFFIEKSTNDFLRKENYFDNIFIKMKMKFHCLRITFY